MSRAETLMMRQEIAHHQKLYVTEFTTHPCKTLDGVIDLLILTFIDHAQFERLNVSKDTVSAYGVLGDLITNINLQAVLLDNISTRFYLNKTDTLKLIKGITSHQESEITRENVKDFAVAINQLREERLARERAQRVTEEEAMAQQAAERERARQAQEAALEEEKGREAVLDVERALQAALEAEQAGLRALDAERARQAARREIARQAEAALGPLEDNAPPPTYPGQAEGALGEEPAPDYLEQQAAALGEAPFPPPYSGADPIFPPPHFSDKNLVNRIREILADQPRMNPYNTPMNIGAFELTFKKSKKIGRSHNTNCFCRPQEGQTHLGIKIIIHNEDEDRYKIRFLIDPDGVSSRPRTEDQRDIDSLEALKTDIQNVRLEATPSTIPASRMAWMEPPVNIHGTTPRTGR